MNNIVSLSLTKEETWRHETCFFLAWPGMSVCEWDQGEWIGKGKHACFMDDEYTNDKCNQTGVRIITLDCVTLSECQRISSHRINIRSPPNGNCFVKVKEVSNAWCGVHALCSSLYQSFHLINCSLEICRDRFVFMFWRQWLPEWNDMLIHGEVCGMFFVLSK